MKAPKSPALLFPAPVNKRKFGHGHSLTLVPRTSHTGTAPGAGNKHVIPAWDCPLCSRKSEILLCQSKSSLRAPWPCRQFGGWGEGKRKRAGNAGIPSSQAHLLFPLRRIEERVINPLLTKVVQSRWLDIGLLRKKKT